MKKTIRSSTHKAGLVLAGLAAALPSAAIREYMFRQLPDLGFGGEARQISSYALDSHVAICGTVFNSAGNRVAYEWDFNYDPVALPGLGGPNSETEDITHDPATGRVRVVGCAQNTDLIWKGVLWREQANGSFVRMVLPTLGGASGDTRCRVENTFTFGQPVRSFMGGWGETPGHLMRAELFCEFTNGSVTPVDLGTLGGANSYVNDVALELDQSTPVLYAFGSAQGSDGTWHACKWTVHENALATGWDVSILAMQPPFGVESEITGCGFFDIFPEIAISGTARSSNGSSRGYCQARLTSPPAVITFPESHADDLFNQSASHATAGTFDGAYTVGEFHSNSQPPFGFVSYAWDLNNDGNYGDEAVGEQNCRLAHELCPPGTSPIIRELCGVTNTAIDEGLWWFAGSSWATFTSSYKPCILEPEARHMPDYVIKPGGAPLDESLLWFNDKRMLSNIASRGGAAIAPLEVHFNELGDTATHEIGHWVGIVRALGRNPSGTLSLQAYNYSNHTYVTINTFQVTAANQVLVSPVSTAAYVDPDERDACFRITFTPNNSNTSGYVMGFMDYTDD